MSHAEGASAAVELPTHLLERIFCDPGLTLQDLANLARVCKSWLVAVEQAGVYTALRQRDLPHADEATVAVLLERTKAISSSRVSCTSKQVYRWLVQPWTCERCHEAFTDGSNTPSSCCYHPGILFSGGLMNGAGLRFTCCNRRAHHIPNGSRDSNGCTTSFHGGGQSAWQRHGTGIKPREVPPGPSTSSPTSSGGGSSSGSSAAGSPSHPYPFINTSKDLQEWHPNQRPGLIELPSRLFFR